MPRSRNCKSTGCARTSVVEQTGSALVIDAFGVELYSFIAIPSRRFLPESLIHGIRAPEKTGRPNRVSTSFRRTECPGSRGTTWKSQRGTGTAVTVPDWRSGLDAVNKSNQCVANFEFTKMRGFA